MWFLCAIVALFAVFATELYLSARLESQTFDEPAHMYAGYYYWLHSDFGINPEHPPLVKLVATLPLLVARPKYPNPLNVFFRAQSAIGGKAMMSEPGADAILGDVRAAVSLFAFVLGVLVVLSAREMFGDAAALLALLLFVFDPLILAHAPLLGTDMGATCCIFGALYAFYRYVKRPSLVRLGVCCAAVGLAFAAKHFRDTGVSHAGDVVRVRAIVRSRRWRAIESCDSARTACAADGRGVLRNRPCCDRDPMGVLWISLCGAAEWTRDSAGSGCLSQRPASSD